MVVEEDAMCKCFPNIISMHTLGEKTYNTQQKYGPVTELCKVPWYSLILIRSTTKL